MQIEVVTLNKVNKSSTAGVYCVVSGSDSAAGKWEAVYDFEARRLGIGSEYRIPGWKYGSRG